MTLKRVILAALFALFGAAAARAGDPATDSRRLAELHLKLKGRLDTLGKIVEDLQQSPPPRDLRDRLSGLLTELPPELAAYREARQKAKPGDDGGLAAGAAATLDRARGISSGYWNGAAPARAFPDDLKSLRLQMAELLKDSERRVPVLAARADGVPAAAAARLAKPGAALRPGASLLNCASAFDGKGCGGAVVSGPAPAAVPRAAAVAPAAAAQPAVSARVPAAPVSSVVSGGLAQLDRASIPLPPASQACVQVVNGPDAAHPEHPTIAGMCRNSPTLAPILAGLLDSVKEQFGTVGGIVTNLVFLLLGLVMSVATGGVGLILKLLALIGAGFAIYKLIKDLVSAYLEKNAAPEGSVEHAAALKKIGVLGGGLLIMITMALVGFGVGKTKPGAAAVKSMEGGLTGAMDKLGLTAAMDGLNSKIPAPLVAMLEKIVGKAPERAKPGEKPVALAEEPLTPQLARAARSSGVTAEVAGLIKNETRSEVAGEMRRILSQSLSRSKTPKVTGAQFNEMLGRLVEFADKSKYAAAEGAETTAGSGFVARMLARLKAAGPAERGISVTRKWGLKGVYPKGMTEIKYKGFGFVKDPAAEVSGGELHELAHLFHTIQMRATLIRSGVPEASAAKFIALMEDGNNYNNLEYFATAIGKPMVNGTASGRFQQLASQLINATETGLRIGEIRLPQGVAVEKGYVYWATRIVPPLLGKSPGEAAVRVTFGAFVSYYIVNMDIRAIPGLGDVSAEKLESLGVPKGQSGLRDVVNNSITNAPATLVASLK